MRVRADAGAASFRRQASLQQHLAGAAEWVREIKPRAQSDPAAASRRAQAARERAAREREERIRAALEQLPQVQAAKRRNGRKGQQGREDAREHRGGLHVTCNSTASPVGYPACGGRLLLGL